MLDRYQQYHKHSLWVSERKCRFYNSPLGDPYIFFMTSAKSSDCSQTKGSRAKWCAVCIPKCFGVIGLLIHLDPPGKPTRGQMGKRSPRVPLVANQTKTHTYTIFLHPRKVRDLPSSSCTLHVLKPVLTLLAGLLPLVLLQEHSFHVHHNAPPWLHQTLNSQFQPQIHCKAERQQPLLFPEASPKFCSKLFWTSKESPVRVTSWMTPAYELCFQTKSVI